MKTRLLRRRWFVATQVLGGVLLAAIAVRAESTVDTNSIQSLKRMSFDDLMNVEITSVSKKEEKLSEAPGAVYVLTQDDIHRSGATSIPEALRLVPGLDVARIDAHTWAISSRGFNDQFANKLLVLIDGRNVYTPLFSGVFWDVQDPMLEDVDRIEVIRGPGATMWGANAVNGVGIPPENLTRIFSHGFTTRKDGHRFDLHSGALAAKEMGGSLRAHSDGPGTGATFTLELPYAPGKANL